MKNLPFFVFDVESIGLHGEGFAVGGGVYLPNGAVQREFLFVCPEYSAQGDADGRGWVSQNVPSLTPTHRHPQGIQSAFWNEWLLAKVDYPDIIMVAECGWPVEARFLSDCVNNDLESNMWQGPYPLHEIATVLALAGLNPLEKQERKESELPIHNPLTDSRQSARLFVEALNKL